MNMAEPSEDIRALLNKTLGTLAASRHLMGKFIDGHHWLTEHDKRIEEIKAALNEIPPAPVDDNLVLNYLRARTKTLKLDRQYILTDAVNAIQRGDHLKPR